MWKEDEQKEEAARRKKAGDKAYGIEDYEAAAEHYGCGAFLDPTDISFLLKLAKAMYGMKKEEECLQYCDTLIKVANTGGSTDKKALIEQAELLKGSVRTNQATCTTDCDAVIAALKQCSGKKAKEKLAEAKSLWKMFDKQERCNKKANKDGDKGLTF